MKMSSKWSFLAAWIAFLTISVCSSAFADAPSPGSLDAAWTDYLSKLDSSSIQPNCFPKRVSPPSGTATQGTVILIHGYTACPQQFFAWADELAGRGYEVLMPLLPGHGRNFSASNQDNYGGFPNSDDWNDYATFADQVNVLAAVSPGHHVIGGLSVGGTVAMAAALRAPETYDRQIIFSPYLEASDWRVRAVSALDRLKFLGLENIVYGWGPSCLEERSLGRAGICDFVVGDVRAISLFGKNILSQVKASSIQTQLVFVENDPVAWNHDQIKAAWRYSKTPVASDLSPSVSTCFLPEGVNHSSISRFDSPHQDKWWIPGLLKSATDFVVDGKSMPQAGPSVIHHFNQCDLGCTSDVATQYHCSLSQGGLSQDPSP